MPISLWHDQFFSFAIEKFGLLTGTSPATKPILNLQESWLKVQCNSGSPIPANMEVQLPHSSFTINLEVFSLELVPFRSVSVLFVGSEFSSAGSCCSIPPANTVTTPDRCFKEAGVQVESHLLNLQESADEAVCNPGMNVIEVVDSGTAPMAQMQLLNRDSHSKSRGIILCGELRACCA